MKMFITLFVASLIAQLLLPWWIILPITLFISYFFNKSPWFSFIISFIAIYLMWLLFSTYQSSMNDHILGNRIGVLFGLSPNFGGWFLMALISGIPGGIVAGFGGLAGQYIRKAF
ncbi:hypothetical protein [Olivibacter domesticus]|uniref:Uncharacterized protein n=1 Tax=Olivibacter domesticus TaxID=407022 RepID=A0A1H7LDD6_OLID1|nr:hypothetical protein [Olivibacter domesticus]SEK96337.1 hypothetical protein SAMN05661044_01621 [Olivibacter domesticus]